MSTTKMSIESNKEGSNKSLKLQEAVSANELAAKEAVIKKGVGSRKRVRSSNKERDEVLSKELCDCVSSVTQRESRPSAQGEEVHGRYAQSDRGMSWNSQKDGWIDARMHGVEPKFQCGHGGWKVRIRTCGTLS